MNRKFIAILLIVSSLIFRCESEKIILEDELNHLNSGMFSVPVGAHT
jgi:hypothetical protein